MTAVEEEDAAARRDEAAALSSIYDDCVRVSQGGSVIEVRADTRECARLSTPQPLAPLPHPFSFSPTPAPSLQIDLPGGGLPVTLTLVAHLPADYPSSSPPVVEAVLPRGGGGGLSAADSASAAVAAAAATAWADGGPGAPILYSVVEALREREEAIAVARRAAEAEKEAEEAARAGGPPPPADAAEADAEAERGGKGAQEGAPPPPPPDAAAADMAYAARAAALRIASHPPVTVKRSTFQAHVAPVASPADARAAVDCLLSHRRIAAATHNIMAYRIVDGVTGAVTADCDDDGEAAAGGRLAFMLGAAKVSGAVVIVSRWYGGILLGPARFGIINNTARDALVAEGFISGGAGGGGGSGKKR